MTLRLTSAQAKKLASRIRDCSKTLDGVLVEKPRKYRNTRVANEHGSFDSKREARRYAGLHLRLKAGQLDWLARQVEFILPGGIIYKADFVYQEPKSIRVIVEDAKGFRTKEFALKAKLMHERGFVVREI
jgi:hypothetical protein